MSAFSISGKSLASVFDSAGGSLADAFDITGRSIFDGSGGGGSINYAKFSVEQYSTVGASQGFDVFSGYIFNTTGSGQCRIVDTLTDELIASIPITTGHGNSLSFSNEYLNEGDEFPLMYVSKDQGDPCDVYVYHVTRAGGAFSMELIRTFRWQLSQVGYYANAAYDTENGILFMYGYTEDSWQSDNGGSNKMLITAWDMTKPFTENADGTFTPVIISRTVMNYFLYAHFGHQFHDGMIWTGSGADRGPIIAIDPTSGKVKRTIAIHKGGEPEGIAFLSDTEMIVGIVGNGFYKYTFERR